MEGDLSMAVVKGEEVGMEERREKFCFSKKGYGAGVC